MRIYSIAATNYNSHSKGKLSPQKNMTQPNFKGQEYEYQARCGSSDRGNGAYCAIYDKYGNIIQEGYGSMYGNGKPEAVRNALTRLHPAHNSTEIISINPDKYYPDNKKGKLYLADPEEGITQAMRAKYDYIALDKMPPLPSLKNLDRKFHAINGDPTDYNTPLKELAAYHKRLLKADLKTYNNIELKNIEDEEYLQQSLANRDKYYFEHLANPRSQYIVDKLNKESYFTYINQKNVSENKAKLDYYSARIDSTRERIKFATELEHILNKAGGILIQRDIAANNYSKTKNSLELLIMDHIDTDHAIKMKNSERLYCITQLQLYKEQKSKLKKQEFIGNEARHKAWDRTDNCGGLEFREAEKQLKAKIKEINIELHNLKEKRQGISQKIAETKPQVEESKQKVIDLIKQADVIYQELQAYYEQNNPF